MALLFFSIENEPRPRKQTVRLLGDSFVLAGLSFFV